MTKVEEIMQQIIPLSIEEKSILEELIIQSKIPTNTESDSILLKEAEESYEKFKDDDSAWVSLEEAKKIIRK